MRKQHLSQTVGRTSKSGSHCDQTVLIRDHERSNSEMSAPSCQIRLPLPSLTRHHVWILHHQERVESRAGTLGYREGTKGTKEPKQCARPQFSLLHLSLTNHKTQQSTLSDFPAQLHPLDGQCLNSRRPGVDHAEPTRRRNTHTQAGKGLLLRETHYVGTGCEDGVYCCSSIYLIIHSLMALRWFLNEHH